MLPCSSRSGDATPRARRTRAARTHRWSSLVSCLGCAVRVVLADPVRFLAGECEVHALLPRFCLRFAHLLGHDGEDSGGVLLGPIRAVVSGPDERGLDPLL